jgi:hypothetical protein
VLKSQDKSTFDLIKTESEMMKLKIERSQINRKVKALGGEYNEAYVGEFPEAI